MRRKPKAKQERSGRKARPVLEKPPAPEDGASEEQQAYIEGQRLRRRLLELNP